MREGDQRLRRGWDGSLGVLWICVCVCINICHGGMSSTT